MLNSQTDELYDQGTDAHMLARLLGRLANKAVIDVGAAHGSITRVCLNAGADAVYAFEPFPENVTALRAAFADVPAVRIFDVAVGAQDGTASLYIVRDKSGLHGEAYHTLVPFEETPTLSIIGELSMQIRTLDSLVADGAIPPSVGIIKVDTERSDFAVLQSMGRLSSSVVMIEFWDDLPETVGPATYSVADVAAFMADRGFSMFAVIKRHDEFEAVQINCADTRPGDWGNVVFIHESVVDEVGAILFEEAALAQTRLVDQAMSFAEGARDRAALLDKAVEEADERLRSLEATDQEARELRAAADERLHSLEATDQEARELRAAAEERLQALEMAHQGAADLRTQLQDAHLHLARAVVEGVWARTETLDEQEAALEAYLSASQDDGLWRWVQPGLGILHQHAPIPLRVPDHYRTPIQPAPTPLVSIVTPALNAAQFIQYTLVSVLGQNYPNLEYVVQDGGSTDGTLAIVQAHAADLTRIDSRRDSGMAQAINRGFSHTTGEIMGYLNADDLLLPGTLHFVAHYFAMHPDVDVVYGHRVLVNGSGAEIGRWVMPQHDDAVLTWADFVPQETLFWRRSLWERAGGQMDESFKFALDWDLLLRFREAGARFKRVPRFLAAFRVHPGQKTSAELNVLGSEEMERLRTHYAGRAVSGEEIMRNLDEYLRRHKVYHKLYRLGVLRY